MPSYVCTHRENAKRVETRLRNEGYQVYNPNRYDEGHEWQKIFTHHLEKARDTGGFMLQLKESKLGKGQEWEQAKAIELGCPIRVEMVSFQLGPPRRPDRNLGYIS